MKNAKTDLFRSSTKSLATLSCVKNVKKEKKNILKICTIRDIIRRRIVLVFVRFVNYFHIYIWETCEVI